MIIYNKLNNNLSMNRGDTQVIPVEICIDEEEYKISQNDVVYFGLMECNQPWECAILKKRYTYEDVDSEGNVVIYLNSIDTEYLHEGLYYYSIKLAQYDSEGVTVSTVIPESKFFIMG